MSDAEFNKALNDAHTALDTATMLTRDAAVIAKLTELMRQVRLIGYAVSRERKD